MADENHPMTIRLSPDRFERLRLEAFERRVSMSAIVNEALDEHAGRRWPAPVQGGQAGPPPAAGNATTSVTSQGG